MRRLGTIGLSAIVHAVVLGAASFSWLISVETVPEPPVVIRFYRAMPPTARLESFQPITEAPPIEAAPEKPVLEVSPPPAPPPVQPATPEPAPAAEAIAPIEPTQVARSADPDLPLPSVAEHSRPGSSYGSLSPGSVDAYAPRGIAMGTGASGLGLPGTGLASPRPGLSGTRLPMTVGSFRGTAAGPESKPRAIPKDGVDDSQDQAGGDPNDRLADVLGRRYSLRLVDARQLGQSTHDGWRYNQIVPLLSEAYRELAPRDGSRPPRGGMDDDIESVRFDPDAIQITYRDGTRHVLAPTRDGLVTLYISAGAGAHGKVEEAQRALGALRRLLQQGVHS